MTAVAKQRPIRGKMVSRHASAGRQTIGPQRPALPAASSASSVTASSRVAIPTPFAPPEPQPPPARGKAPREPARIEPRQQPSARIQGRAPQRAIEPPIVRQMPARARRAETFESAAAPTPSKMAELRSTIARQQQRLDELESGSGRADDMRERVEVVAELLDEAIDLVTRPEGVMNRKRLRAKLEEARKVIR